MVEKEFKIKNYVYFNKDMPKGTIIKETDLVALRPNKGIDARQFYKLIGKKTKVLIKALEPIDSKKIN